MQTKPASNFEILAQGYAFLEAPRVSPEGDVWFADLTGSGVYRKREGHEVETMLADRQWVGGMAFDASGQVLLGGRGGILAFDPATGATRDVLTEIEGEPIIAVNDMEGDGKGGLFAGTIDFVSIFEKGAEPSPGLFFHMAADGKVTVLRRDLFASNGIAAGPCGQWLYHSETSCGIWRYPLGDDGLPGSGELLVEVADGDGLVADAEGNLWLACWESGQLLEFASDGTRLQALTFPFPHVVSLAFGERAPRGLYVVTGGNADVPQGGAVLRMAVDVPGLAGPLTRLIALNPA